MAQPADAFQIQHNSIHFRPLNAHLLQGVLWASTMLKTNASEERWHGHVVHFLAKTILVGGFALNSAISLTEAVAFSALALFAGILNSLTQKQFRCLQKATFICGAHSLHSAGLWLGQLALLFVSPWFFDKYSSYHLTRVVIDHLSYLASAIAIYTLFSARVTGNASQAFGHIAGVVADDGLDFICDFGRAIMRDRGDYFPLPPDQAAQRERFFTFVGELDWSRIQNDPEYRRDQLGAFLHEFGVGQLVQGENLGIIVNSYSEPEKNYQEFLQQKVKAAFHALYQDDHLNLYLKADKESGKEALKGALSTIPLANYTQWLEISEEELACPEQFTSEALQPYQDRYQRLTKLKADVTQLSEPQKQKVIEALLKADNSPLDGDADLQLIFNEVSTLSDQLHRGKLISVMKINPYAGEGEDVVSYENLFAKAYQEAIAELPADQPADA